MPTKEDYASLENEIGLMHRQLSAMLARLDALQMQVDSARAQLGAQESHLPDPSHNRVWRDALMPLAPLQVEPAGGSAEQISWEVVFCSAIMLASAGYYLTLFLPHLLNRIR
jgi:hypothetical protein